MRIERADVSDADILADMWVDLATEQREFGTHLRPAGNRTRVREDVVRRITTGDVIVARGEGDGTAGIFGYVSFGIESRSYDQDVKRGIVYNLYVRPTKRNAGIGWKLLDAAERRLADKGVDIVCLEVMADNAAARRFYDRRGYRPHRVELEKPVDTSDTVTDVPVSRTDDHDSR